MTTTPTSGTAPAQDVQDAVSSLYRTLLRSWNDRDATAFAAGFAPAGVVVGFDGSEMQGPDEIRSTLADIFAHHQTGRYYGKVREIRELGPGVVLLRAVSGMVPAGASDLNPALNTVQALVAVLHDGAWRIAHYQNTPAQLHGRPEVVEQMTAELRGLLGSETGE